MYCNLKTLANFFKFSSCVLNKSQTNNYYSGRKAARVKFWVANSSFFFFFCVVIGREIMDKTSYMTK